MAENKILKFIQVAAAAPVREKEWNPDGTFANFRSPKTADPRIL